MPASSTRRARGPGRPRPAREETAVGGSTPGASPVRPLRPWLAEARPPSRTSVGCGTDGPRGVVHEWPRTLTVLAGSPRRAAPGGRRPRCRSRRGRDAYGTGEARDGSTGERPGGQLDDEGAPVREAVALPHDDAPRLLGQRRKSQTCGVREAALDRQASGRVVDDVEMLVEPDRDRGAYALD